MQLPRLQWESLRGAKGGRLLLPGSSTCVAESQVLFSLKVMSLDSFAGRLGLPENNLEVEGRRSSALHTCPLRKRYKGAGAASCAMEKIGNQYPPKEKHIF